MRQRFADVAAVPAADEDPFGHMALGFDDPEDDPAVSPRQAHSSNDSLQLEGSSGDLEERVAPVAGVKRRIFAKSSLLRLGTFSIRPAPSHGASCAAGTPSTQ